MRLNVHWVFFVLRMEDSQPFLLDIFELPPVDGPTQHGQDDQYQQDRYRDENVEYFHDLQPRLPSLTDGAESKRIQHHTQGAHGHAEACGPRWQPPDESQWNARKVVNG